MRNAKNAKVVELAVARHAEDRPVAAGRGVEELKRVLSGSPQDVDLRLALAREYQALGMWAEALEEFALCLPSRTDDVDLLCDLAVCYLRQDGQAHAAVLAQQALARDPENAYARLIEGRITHGPAGRPEGPRILVSGMPVEAAPELARERVEALLGASRRLRDEGNMEQAAAVLRRILAVHPGDVTAAGELGLLSAAAGNWREAFRWFNEVRRQSPADWVVRWRMAAAAWQMDEPEKAAALAREALAVDPGAVEAVELLIDIAFERSRLQDAEFWLRRLLAIDPENAEGLYRLAWIELRSGRIREAAARFRECTEAPRTGCDALYHLGLALTAAGEATEAASALGRAWEALPADDSALGLAQAKLLAGDLSGARDALGMLSEPDEEAARLWHALAVRYQDQGDETAAKSAYGEAVRLDSDRAAGYFALQSHS